MAYWTAMLIDRSRHHTPTLSPLSMSLVKSHARQIAVAVLGVGSPDLDPLTDAIVRTALSTPSPNNTNDSSPLHNK